VGATEKALRKAGGKGFEAFVFWSGMADGGVFEVLTAHVPEQTAYRTRNGLSVRVEGEALHRLNVWLYENGELLGAQVHAHPTDAYHSNTDDSFPIVTALGGLSLVVPDFCRRGLLPGSAAYRLTAEGWKASEAAVADLVEVV
jgi:hypothetical protein